MNIKKEYIYICILLIVFCIILITSLSKKEIPNYNTVPEEIIPEKKIGKLVEEKVTGYHLVTYKQTARKNSFIQSIKVTASNEDKVRFVIGTIDKDSFVQSRFSFELECKKGENNFELLDKRYFLKKGEYLFMDDFGQDILFTQKGINTKSLVQSETNKVAGKMIMSESNYILPFEYALKEAKEYNVLVIGNDITTKDGGRGVDSTSDELDYYSITKARLENTFEEVNINRINILEWETLEGMTAKNTWLQENLKDELLEKIDLVIIQLGDNYKETDVKNIETDITNLVNKIRNDSPNAEIIWIGPLKDTNENLILSLPGICEKLIIKFIRMNDLYSEEYKSLNPQFSENEYYPNNEGMQIIANRIVEVLGFDF